MKEHTGPSADLAALVELRRRHPDYLITRTDGVWSAVAYDGQDVLRARTLEVLGVRLHAYADHAAGVR